MDKLQNIKFGIILFGSKFEIVIDINRNEGHTKKAILDKLDDIYHTLGKIKAMLLLNV